MIKKSKPWNWEAATALFISGLALATSIWQGYAAQKHARLSVTPFMQTEVHETRDSVWELTLTNKGVGPAMIEKITYEWAGKNYGEEVMDVVQAVTQKSKLGNVMYSTMGETIFSPNESHVLIHLTGADVCAKMHASFASVKLTITYTSIYEEKWINENNTIKKVSN